MRVVRVIPDLSVPDLRAAADFYGGYLGLEQEDLGLDWVGRYLTSEGAEVQVVTHDETAPEPPSLSLAVDDVDEAYAEARRRGYEIVHPLTTERWGVRRFFVRGPGGRGREHPSAPDVVVTGPIPEPSTTDDLRALLLGYLDHYRSTVAAAVAGPADAQLYGSAVPSGWTPAGMLTHLAYMERRWLEWGFLGADVSDPWGDRAEDGWREDADIRTALRRLSAVGERTREIVEQHALDERASAAGRFATAEEVPHLHWILLHVLQEYARHAGHLDIVTELTHGGSGR